MCWSIGPAVSPHPVVLRSVLLAVAMLATTVPSPARAQPEASREPFSMGDAKVTVLADTVEATLAMLTERMGCDPKASLSYKGRMDEEGWSIDVSGTFAGQPLALGYRGTLDPTSNRGRFAGSGSVGSTPWEASGTVEFSEDRSIMRLDGSARLGEDFSRDWTGSWLLSRQTPLTTRSESVDVVRAATRPTTVIVVEIASWEHTRPNSTWFHTRIVIVVVARSADRCKLDIREKGTESGEGVGELEGSIRISLV